MQESYYPEVITIGETMALVTPTIAEPLDTADLFRLDAGGAESNVASHLAQLGHHVAWVSQLGDDALGRRIERQIRERGVDTSWVRVDRTAPTGVYFKDPGSGVQYFRSGSAASQMTRQILDGLPLERAAVVHVSGITPALSPSCSDLIDAIVDRVAGTATMLSFDANYRHGLWDVATASSVLLGIARRSDFVFVGLDEAHTLWGAQTGAAVRELIGPSPRLIIKDGDVGATEFSVDATTFVPAIPTDVVEVVGAGDAFAAGYLSAHLSGASADGRLLAGHERAVLSLQSTSDLPTVAG